MHERKKNQETSSSNHSFVELLKANLELGIKKTIAVPITQPLQNIMRVQQKMKDPTHVLSAPQAFLEIYKTKKMSAFFRGAGIGAAKELFKNGVYKGALIRGAPGLAKEVLAPLQISTLATKNQAHLAESIIAATIAASADVAFGGPLEHWATFLATSHGKDASASFAGEFKAQETAHAKLKLLYRGAGPAWIKGAVAFGAFFSASKPINNWVRQMHNLKEHEIEPWDVKALSAILTGASVAATSSPFDIITTQARMPNPSKKSVLEALKSNFQKYGLNGITAGMPVKFIMVSMGWAINYSVTQNDSKEEDKETLRPKIR